MIIQAGDLAVEVDTGANESGVLQRLEGFRWIEYRVDGQPVRWLVKLDGLKPGRYRVS